MKHKIWVTILCILLCAAVVVAAVVWLDSNASPFATDPTRKNTESTSPSTETVASATESPIEETTVPTELAYTLYIVPKNYPEIDIRSYITEPPVLPFPADDAPEEEWIAFFYGLLSARGSWYNLATENQFRSPKNLITSSFFRNGVSGVYAELTEAEIDFLTRNGFNLRSTIFRAPVTEMNAVLNMYFDTSLDEIQNSSPHKYYFSETDSFYCAASNGHFASIAGISGYSILDNGDYSVRYGVLELNRVVEREIILRRVDNYFKIISNLATDPAYAIDWDSLDAMFENDP